MSAISLSDQELWGRVRQGDEAAYTTLFDRYHGTLYNYGCKLSPNSALVEDAVQDVFIDVWRLRKTLTQNIASIKFYLYRALRRRIHRGSTLASFGQITLIQEHELILSAADSETELIAHETSKHLERQLQISVNQLPDRQAEALTLRYYSDFTIKETALLMGVSEKSVRNFIYKALVALRAEKNQLLSLF